MRFWFKKRKPAPTPPSSSEMAPSPENPQRMVLGMWSVYFLAKLFLYWKGMMGFHPLENFAFAVVLLVPVAYRWLRWLRLAVAIPMAFALLYYDSWLPPASRVVVQANSLTQFDLAYLVELMGRFINPKVVASLVVIWVVYWIVSQWIRVGLLVLIAIVTVPMVLTYTGKDLQSQPNVAVASSTAKSAGAATTDGKNDLNAVLKDFYVQEAARSVTLQVPPPDAQPFDFIFIHICSLAWDDLRAMELDTHPIWKHFDITFTNFNSASSYSGPAAIRVLRAPCGQPSHTALYSPPTSESCYLMGSLRRAGFQSSFAMNHDGHFEAFLQTVQKQDLNFSPLPLDNLPVAQHSFDESPIYDDAAVLKQWMVNRKDNSAARMALYYNTISLHDGNRLVGPNSGLNSLKTYKMRLTTLLDTLDNFMQQLESSGMKAVVVVVPEHGAAIRGDKMQIAGLREIPSPTITLVPVGIKVVSGQVKREGNAATIKEPSSYLAMAQIIANMLKKPPFEAATFSVSDYVADLPTTTFVAENADTIVIRHDNQYYLRQELNGSWSVYDPGL